MGNGRIAGYLAGALLALPCLAEEPGIQVNVFNYAGIPEQKLEAAKATAGRVLASAGLSVTWDDYPITLEAMKACERCQDATKPTTLSVSLLPDSMAARWPHGRHHLAYSIMPKRRRFGNLTRVYMSQVQNVADRERFALDLVLGHVIAHEIGHLLLGPGSHSRRGIMSFPVSGDYLRLAVKGQLNFTPEQAQRMQLDVQARSMGLAELREFSGKDSFRQ